MNKSFRFQQPELSYLGELKKLTYHSETDIIRCALCLLYHSLCDSGEYEDVRKQYFKDLDYYKYKDLQKKVFR